MKNFIAISGPSGTGKTTLCRELQRKKQEINFSVSCTTRRQRYTEEDGVDYHFISMEEFEEKVNKNEFVEYEEVHGDYYGTMKKPLEDAIRGDRLLLFEVDVKGAKSIQSLYPKNTVTIFILPPNLDDLRKRLRRRGTDSEKRIKKRMDRLELELKEKDWFDYHVINNQIEHASNELIKIIEKQTEGVLYES